MCLKGGLPPALWESFGPLQPHPHLLGPARSPRGVGRAAPGVRLASVSDRRGSHVSSPRPYCPKETGSLDRALGFLRTVRPRRLEAVSEEESSPKEASTEPHFDLHHVPAARAERSRSRTTPTCTAARSWRKSQSYRQVRVQVKSADGLRGERWLRLRRCSLDSPGGLAFMAAHSPWAFLDLVAPEPFGSVTDFPCFPRTGLLDDLFQLVVASPLGSPASKLKELGMADEMETTAS